METSGSAVERYEAFEKLKDRFNDSNEKLFQGGVTSARSHGETEPVKNGRVKRRYGKKAEISDVRGKSKDTTSNKAEYASKTLMVGQWRNTDFTKSLLTQDCDGTETGSVASCDSSAYSSKSGSSFMSPYVGSCTELSDAGSADTCAEYDIYPGQTKNTWQVISDGNVPSLDQLYPSHVNTRLWNKLIEDWTLDSPTHPSKGRSTSGEVKASTPISSSENLLDEVHPSTSMCTDSNYLSEDHRGKSAWEKSAPLSPYSVKREDNLARNQTGANKTATKSESLTPSRDMKDEETEKACPEITTLKTDAHEAENSTSADAVAKQLEGAAISSGTVIQIKSGNGKGFTTPQCSRPNIQSVSDRIKQLKRSQSESVIETSSAPSYVTRRSKFGEAYKMYRELQTVESPSPSGRRRNLVSVKERAQLFGQK